MEARAAPILTKRIKAIHLNDEEKSEFSVRCDPEQSWRQEQHVTREQLDAEMLARPSNAESGRVRSQSIPDKPVIHHDENFLRSKLEHAKLEASKRRLQERYQEYVNAKKQISMQVVDPKIYPSQATGFSSPLDNGKPRNDTNISSKQNWSR